MKNPYFPAPESLSFEIAWAAHHSYGSDWVHFMPRIVSASLWHITAGELRVESDDTSQIARAGDWVWRGPCGARRMQPGTRGASWQTVGLIALCGGKNWFAPPHSLIFQLDPAQSERGNALLSLLIEGKTAGASRLEIDGLSRALMGWLWSAAGDAAWSPNFPEWLKKALQHLENEPGVAVSELAREAHFSPAQFRRLWEKHLGASPRETVSRRRLEIARKLLESEEWSVSEIAARSGFAGAAQLARAFRGAFGASPLEWRRAGREEI